MTDAEMLEAMADVLESYRFGEEPQAEGGTESYNNEDVIEVLAAYHRHCHEAAPATLEWRFTVVAARAPVWFPDVFAAKSERSIAVHHGLELGSEAGEVLDVLKRYNRWDGARAMRYRREQLPTAIARALADVLCNVAVIADLFDVDLTAALGDVIARNDLRFPEPDPAAQRHEAPLEAP